MLGKVDLNDSASFRLHLAVIQPTPFCNIDCRYCYLPDRSVPKRMTLETCEKAFDFLFSDPSRLAGRVAIAWHAGEPLTVPIEFYERAFALEPRYFQGQASYDNWFQTNGTLVNQEWCDFIRRRNVRIGLSLDGPERFHDLKRVDRAGKGTFRRAVHAAELFAANGINYDIISVLSDSMLEYPDEIWSFFRDLGVKALAFSLEETKGVHLDSSFRDHASLQRVSRFFTRMLELRDRDNSRMHIREVDYFLNGIPHWASEFRSEENVPLCIVGVAWNGDVSTFSPELIGMKDVRYGDFTLGNVATSSMAGILNNPKFRQLYQEISDGVRHCRERCPYYCACGGGAPASKLGEHGSFNATETLVCRQKIMAIGNAVFTHLEQQYGVNRTAGQSVRDRVIALAGHLSQHPPVEVHSRNRRVRALE